MTVRIPPSPPVQKKAPSQSFCGVLFIAGGEGGIRTRGKFDPTHAFQACDLNRSSTSPESSAICSNCIVMHGDNTNR
jgi:hypothetical protein